MKLVDLDTKSALDINDAEIAANCKLDSEIEKRDEILRLAGLNRLEYEGERANAAKRLGLRATVLDKLVGSERSQVNDTGPTNAVKFDECEPWPEPVDLALVLEQAVAQYEKYLTLPFGGAAKMALWSMGTHVFQRFGIFPRLAITAAEKGCGKTLVLRLLKTTTARSALMTNANIAPLFRVITKCRPTIALDEFDNYGKDNPTLLSLLNDGHAAGGKIWRCEGEDNHVVEYEVYCPVAIGGIGRPPETLMSRSIEIRMERKRPTDKTRSFRGDRIDLELEEIKRKFARAALDCGDALKDHDPDVGALHNRDADNWRPLLSIADVAGGRWPSLVRQIAYSAISTKEDGSVREKLLSDIRDIFKETGRDRLPSAEIIAALAAMETRPWAEWRNGKPMTQTALARQLDKFKIGPSTKRDGKETFKGYLLTDFADVFERYLPGPDQTVTPSQPQENQAQPCVFKPSQAVGCDGLRGGTNADKSDICDGVTVQKGRYWASGRSSCDYGEVFGPPSPHLDATDAADGWQFDDTSEDEAAA